MRILSRRPNLRISKAEKMPFDDRESYFWTGRSALEIIKLVQRTTGRSTFYKILDMASGHGRVLRWLKFAYPKARLTVCEVQESALEFCERTFGAKPLAPSDLKSEKNQDSYDLIWVGSLLTHLDIKMWDETLSLLYSKLDENGVLIFTTHGDLVATRLGSIDNYGLDSESTKKLISEYSDSGFGYQRYPNDLTTNESSGNYGVSVSSTQFVLGYMRKFQDMQLIFLGEMKWANHQDVYAFIRKEIDTKFPEVMVNWMSEVSQ